MSARMEVGMDSRQAADKHHFLNWISLRFWRSVNHKTGKYF